MEELKTQLEAHESTWTGQEQPDTMTEAAQKWAAHCLATYTGELLKRGLAVAQALSEFGGEFYQVSADRTKGKSDVD